VQISRTEEPENRHWTEERSVSLKGIIPDY
jgi:hypothetical protein